MMGESAETVYNRKGGGRVNCETVRPEDVAPSSADSFVKECRKRQAGYPEGHNQHEKIDAMIARHQSRARAA